jgi:hypothetical protein
MGIKLTNNANATLAAGIDSSATSITLTSGQGARFPTLAGGDYFYATLVDTSNNLEIVKCTARSTDVLTVVRAQESTTARAYVTGDRIEIRITAQTFVDATSIYDVNTGSTGYFQLPRGTTAQRPASPINGMVRFNTDLTYTEEYRNGVWVAISNVFVAEGGTITSVTEGGTTYKIHTFTSSGTFTVLSGSATVDYLVVAGGGGGGGDRGGGGGAGGMTTGTTNANVGANTITIGAGGAGGGTNGNDGGSSTAIGVTALGGGSAGGGAGSGRTNGNSGGSGGGGGAQTNITNIGGSGTSGQGNSGGNSFGGSTLATVGAGGGGGKGAAGSNGGSGVGGNGGNGSASSISGSSVTYAGGGGGAIDARDGNRTAGIGGTGGGGAAFNTGATGQNGTANTGGGGGGGGVDNAPAANAGGSGGSGIVIIRYPI